MEFVGECTFLIKAASGNYSSSAIAPKILAVLGGASSLVVVNEVVLYISENFGLPCYETNSSNYKWVVCKLILEAIKVEIDTFTHKKFEAMEQDSMQWRILKEMYDNLDSLFQSMLTTAHILRQWMKSPEASLSLYYAAIEIEEKSYEAWFYVAITLRILGKKDQALNAYLTSIQICPENADAHFNLGNLYLEDYEQPLKALQEYTSASNCHKPSAMTRIGKIYNLIAECQHRLKDMENSLRSLTTGIAMDPTYMDNYHDITKHIHDQDMVAVWNSVINYIAKPDQIASLISALSSIKHTHFIIPIMWNILSNSPMHQAIYNILQHYIIK